jgi:hypothetical protein
MGDWVLITVGVVALLAIAVAIMAYPHDNSF